MVRNVGRPRGGSTSRRRSRGLAAAALAAVVVTITWGSSSVTAPSVNAEGEACESGSETYYPLDVPALPDPHVVPLGGLVVEIELDREHVFVLHEVSERMVYLGPGTAYRSDSRAISRVDRGTRAVTRGDSLCVAYDMELAGRWLWVLDIDYGPGSCSAALDQFDPTSLRRTGTVQLPPPPPVEPAPAPSEEASPPTEEDPTPCDQSAMTAGPDGHLWVAVGRHLHRLAGDDGDIEATVVTAAPISALAVAPDGRHLYGVEDGRVVRRDVTSGVVQQSSDLLGLSGVLAAAPAGPWVGVAVGDGQQLVLLDAERLEETARLDRADTGYGVALGQRTLWALSSPWAEDDPALRGLYCADATTGRLHTQKPQGPRATELAADGAGAYLNTIDETPDRGGLYIVEPDASCGW